MSARLSKDPFYETTCVVLKSILQYDVSHLTYNGNMVTLFCRSQVQIEILKQRAKTKTQGKSEFFAVESP